MPVRLYLDVHVDKAIHDQLRLRGVDVLRAQDDDAAEMVDDKLLQHATDLGGLVFTQDIRFKAMAEEWQRAGKSFSGLLFGNQLGVKRTEVVATSAVRDAVNGEEFLQRVQKEAGLKVRILRGEDEARLSLRAG